ncbi:DUF2784 domain-containing protein [Balneolaceae bacterium YR4-1]|uniref:DUF2784 domain-containing protein n=1 Tax=Halalkalibaculum roseum TaxID=2709311 RepID=A0A6M1SWW7_9BACT|nr:DUF2784 domain-containing protein [Halalkalibaculum roseum]NGP75554.1 DUF2784 domain-containing protein [Halalkalibaculum roseum]
MMYQFLDIFFFVFHTCLILFNLFGWIWKATRKWNLLTLSATAFSWIILGIWYGFGYCPCTHWHWLVRRELGYSDMPNSYIKFLLDELVRLNFDAFTVDLWTGILFFSAFVVSLYVNLVRGRSRN